MASQESPELDDEADIIEAPLAEEWTRWGPDTELTDQDCNPSTKGSTASALQSFLLGKTTGTNTPQILLNYPQHYQQELAQQMQKFASQVLHNQCLLDQIMSAKQQIMQVSGNECAGQKAR